MGYSQGTLTQQPGLGTAERLPEVGVDGDGACLKEKKKKGTIFFPPPKNNLKPMLNHTQRSVCWNHIKKKKRYERCPWFLLYLLILPSTAGQKPAFYFNPEIGCQLVNYSTAFT